MTFVYPCIIIGLLTIIVYQDFRHRALSVSVLIAALLIVITNNLVVNGWEHALLYAGVNLLLIAIQMIGITLYFSIKRRGFTNIINTYLGSGDLWFYGILTCSFSPLNFMLFNLMACMVILVIYAFTRFNKGGSGTIPLAGCLALAMVLVLMMSFVLSGIRPYDDWILASKMFAGN